MTEKEIKKLRKFVLKETIELINKKRRPVKENLGGIIVEYIPYWLSDDILDYDIKSFKASESQSEVIQKIISNISKYNRHYRNDFASGVIQDYSKIYAKMQMRTKEVCRLANLLEKEGVSWDDILEEAGA